MRRRVCLASLFSVAAGIARAQPASVPVVGYLGFSTEQQFGRRVVAFREGLAAAGYHDGRNVTILYRWAEGDVARLPALADELVRSRVNVIAAPGSIVSAQVAKAATTTLPIVFEAGVDPVFYGLVASLNRPGGNITGVTSMNVELAAKRIELLQDLMPRLAVVAVLLNPSSPQAGPQAAQVRQAAADRGLRLHELQATTAGEIDAAFASLAPQRVQALLVAADAYFVANRRQLASLALRHAMPAIYHTRDFPDAGGLMSYGGNVTESHRQAGVYVGRVLKGERPADLPVQQVTQFEMVINLATAKALGLTIPPAVLVRANEVIE